METLNKNTKRAKRWINDYFNSHYFSVMSYYGRPSARKISIENDIKEKMYKMDCKNYAVLSGNSFNFTCGYTSKDENTIYIETVGNTYKIFLGD